MEALLKSDKALDILTTISLAQFLVIAVIFLGIGAAIYKFRGNIKEFLEDFRNKENRKEDCQKMVETHDKKIAELEKHHNEDMQKFQEKQLEYRQQSISKQTDIDARFVDVNDKLDSLTKLILNHYEETKKLKRNELREKLLNSYRYFTSLETNPKQEWNEMEAESFWHTFKDYEDLGGNGYMHSVVKPAMEKLTIIPI